MGRQKAVQVEGLRDVLKALKRLPERNRRHALRPAVTKASTPVVKAAKRLAPKGAGLKPDGTPREHLQKTIKRTSVKWYRNTDTFAVAIGPEKNKAFHSHLVHDGTKPHDIILGKPMILSTKTSLGRGASGRFESVQKTAFIPAGTKINHPGSAANPFLQNAIDATRGQVESILKKSILENIDKQVKKLRKKK